MRAEGRATLKILLGRGVANHPGFIDLLRLSDAGAELRVGVHHFRPTGIADGVDFVQEEPTATSADYVSACIAACRSYGAQIFWPGRELGAIAERVGDFNAVGVKVLTCGSVAALELVEDKLLFSRSVDLDGANGVPSMEFRDIGGFDSAYSAIRSSGDIVCFKPRRGIFGRGFRVVREDIDVFEELFGDPSYRIDLHDARRRFASRSDFRPMIAMPWLAGEEWSVDCFRAADGSRFSGIARQKAGDEQRITVGTGLIPMAEGLARRFGIHGLFNCQFRYHRGTPFVLEINPRPAGGIGGTTFTGNNLVEATIRDALDLSPRSPVSFPDMTVKMRPTWWRSG